MENKVLLPQEMAVESGTFVSPLRMTSSPTIEYTTLNTTLYVYRRPTSIQVSFFKMKVIQGWLKSKKQGVIEGKIVYYLAPIIRETFGQVSGNVRPKGGHTGGRQP